MKVALINHGCAKNLVDSELMLGALTKEGIQVTLDEKDAEIVIVNTCSFIHDAEKESVHSILEMTEARKKVIVTGCLPQKYNDELKKAIPEISGMIGATNPAEIVKIVKDLVKNKKYKTKIEPKPQYVYPENVTRQQITVGASSYLKIGEGCNYECGYCIIPKLRGEYVSRPMENILQEAEELVKKGVREIVLIAQDTSSYGIDLYGEKKLPELLKQLNKIKDLSWLRVMYTYPTEINENLLKTIAECDKVVKYIDIPLQHSHPRILKEMKRPVMDYEILIKTIRNTVPNIAIRTSLIVGYPGETDEEFTHLYNFVKKMKFDRLGVFEYSREKNTYSYGLKPQIKAKVKKQRRKILMELQQQISRKNNSRYKNKVINCIVEGYTDSGTVILRSQKDAPEVDGLVYAKTNSQVVPGDIERVEITDFDDYDLYGEIVEE